MIIQTAFEYILQNPSILVLAFLICLVKFGLSRLFSKPEPSKNPFSIDHVHPPEPLVTDQNARNKVLKQKFKPHKVPDNLDAIVIGSGIGGMTAAVLMARAGKRVLVLEQHDQAGGCCHTFHEKGFEFDTGIHYISKTIYGDERRVLMDQLTSGRMVYPRMDDEYDVVALGDPSNARIYGIPTGRQNYKDNLITHFPDEKEAIKKFMNLIGQESKSALHGFYALKQFPKWLSIILTKTGLYCHIKMFRPYIKYFLTSSLQDVLDSITGNEELKAVISYVCGDYGAWPSKTSFAFHSVLINHYMDGAQYIRGGPSEMVYQMVSTLERLGGAVLVQAPVAKILIDGRGKATGVKVSRKGEETDIFAENVVSNAGVANTFYRLLPQEIATKSCIYPLIEKIGSSVSYITVFVGLNGNKEELGLKSNNVWYFPSNQLEREIEEFLSLQLEEVSEAEAPMLFISAPSAKDPTWEERNPNKSTMLIITFARYEWFERWQDEKVKKRGEDYDGLKNAIGRNMWHQTAQLFPKLDGRVEYFDVGTPLSNKYYLGAHQGQIYGLNHTMERFKPEAAIHLRPKTNIPGLYLSGQDIASVGHSGAMMGGLFCASEILHRDLHQDVRKLVKEIRTERNNNLIKKKRD